jgi:hypothetical protein
MMIVVSAGNSRDTRDNPQQGEIVRLVALEKVQHKELESNPKHS